MYLIENNNCVCFSTLLYDPHCFDNAVTYCLLDQFIRNKYTSDFAGGQPPPDAFGRGEGGEEKLENIFGRLF